MPCEVFMASFRNAPRQALRDESLSSKHHLVNKKNKIYCMWWSSYRATGHSSKPINQRRIYVFSYRAQLTHSYITHHHASRTFGKVQCACDLYMQREPTVFRLSLWKLCALVSWRPFKRRKNDRISLGATMQSKRIRRNYIFSKYISRGPCVRFDFLVVCDLLVVCHQRVISSVVSVMDIHQKGRYINIWICIFSGYNVTVF